MGHRQIYASLDIGSSSIKLLVGEVVHNNVRILRVETVPSRGVKRGVVIDGKLVSEDIKSLVTKTEYLLNIKLKNIILNIPSICLNLYHGRGSYIIKREEKVIQGKDIFRALKASMQFEINNDEIIVSSIPLSYVFDGRQTKKMPIGETARQVVVNSLVLTAPKDMIFPLVESVEQAGLEILDLCVSAYSLANEALDETYLNEGVVIIDIGAQVTMVTVFKNGYLQTLGSVAIGGYQITKDIARYFGIEMSQAEQFKIKFGVCNIQEADDDVLHVRVDQQGETVFTQKDLAKIIKQRVENQMLTIKKQVSDILNGENFHIVVVGGGAQLDGIDQIVSSTLGFNSRVYTPDTIGARKSMFTANLGAIYFMLSRLDYIEDLGSSVDLKGYEQAIQVRKSVLKGIGSDEGTLLNRITDFLFGEEQE